MSFRLVPKSVTLNDLERRNGPYSALFHRTRWLTRRAALIEDIGLPKFSATGMYPKACGF